MNINTILLQRCSDDIVTPNENIFFDKITYSLGNAIDYNFLTGTITIRKLGTYYINWCVSVRENYKFSNDLSACVVLSNNEATNSILNNYYDLVGYNTIIINKLPLTLSLKNLSKENLIFTKTLEEKASLLILEVVGPRGEEGPRGESGSLGLAGYRGPIGCPGINGREGNVG